jgi:ribonucleoside-diphosphate reductase alpha chain
MEGAPQTLTHEASAGEPLAVARYFTSPGVHPFDSVEWELRDARIGFGDTVSFEQPGVEFPATWSQNATNIVAQKYFRGKLDSPARERSVKQMIGRVRARSPTGAASAGTSPRPRTATRSRPS